jgi:hypothetical protein
MDHEIDRILDGIVLPQSGRVKPSDGPAPWTVVTDEGDVVVIQQYLPRSRRSRRLSIDHAQRRLRPLAVVALACNGIERHRRR